MTEPTIGTRDALKLIGLADQAWRNAIQLGHYRSPPEVVGRQREWTLDHLIAGRWFASNIRAGMKMPFAGECSALLLRVMQEQPEAPEFFVYVVVDEDTERADIQFLTEHLDDPKAQLVFTVPVARWRSDMQRALDRVLAKTNGATRH